MSFPVGNGSGRERELPERDRPHGHRKLAVALLAVVGLLLTPVASVVALSGARPVARPVTSPRTTPAAVPFVARSGERLTLGGKPFMFVGFNINNANGRATCEWRDPGMTIEQSLDAIGPGQQVFRAWFFQPLATRSGAIDWSVFDRTLAAARSHGQRVVAVLGNQWAICDSGGYRDETWYRGGYAKAPDGPKSPRSYLDWTKAVVAHYANDPTILAWQLLNEPEDASAKDGVCSATAAATLRSWVHTVAAAVKAIDPRHLVSIGAAGDGRCGAIGAEYEALYADPNVDLCNYHDYSNPSSPLLGGIRNGLGARVKQAHALGKPLIVDEIGIGLEAHAGGSLAKRAEQLQSRLTGMLDAGVAGVLVWDFGTPSRTDYDVSAGDPFLPLLATIRSR